MPSAVKAGAIGLKCTQRSKTSKFNECSLISSATIIKAEPLKTKRSGRACGCGQRPAGHQQRQLNLVNIVPSGEVDDDCIV
eukprot:scaffold209791_cov42-Prasinocladus_malaysianus.AAC.1